MLSLRQIEMLRAVMLTGSVSRAADMLHVSPPSVSRMLKHTESTAGVTFFRRTATGLVPTPEVRALLDDLEAIHDRIVRINRRIEHIGDIPDDRLSIGTSPGLGLSLAPRALKQLQQVAPDTKPVLDALHIDEIVPNLLLRRLDLVLTIFDVDDPRVTVTRLGEGRLVCLVPEDHPLAGVPSVAFRDLANHPFIGFEEQVFQHRLIEELAEQTGCRLDIAVRVRLMVTACFMVGHGFGVCLMDNFTADGNPLSGIRAVPLEEEVVVPLNVVHNPQAPLSVNAERFLDIVRAIAGGAKDG